MREILFRGKANGGCCWVYGHYAVLNDGYRLDWKRHYLLSGELRYNDQYGKEDVRKVEIDPNTLGQYTGLKDKNGKRIFEGDVVTFKTTAYSFKPCIVEYRNDTAQFVVRKNDRSYPMADDFVYEVIGNIHDNPELIGGMSDENT